MYKILVDLDVLTLAFWKGDKKDIAIDFLERIKKEEFIVITPYSLIELINNWNDKSLAKKIVEFYFDYSANILSKIEILKLIDRKKINEQKIIYELEKIGIKSEDSVLILLSSIFNVDYLITFNRKHLKNNKDKINIILKKNDLKTIKIAEPNEI